MRDSSYTTTSFHIHIHSCTNEEVTWGVHDYFHPYSISPLRHLLVKHRCDGCHFPSDSSQQHRNASSNTWLRPIGGPYSRIFSQWHRRLCAVQCVHASQWVSLRRPAQKRSCTAQDPNKRKRLACNHASNQCTGIDIDARGKCMKTVYKC